MIPLDTENFPIQYSLHCEIRNVCGLLWHFSLQTHQIDPASLTVKFLSKHSYKLIRLDFEQFKWK